MKIELYPSLQFGWDVPQFQTVAKEYLKETPVDEKAGRDEDFADQIILEDFEEEEE